MSSEFGRAGRDARSAIRVPQFNVAAIERRARQRFVRARLAALCCIAAIFAAGVGTGAAAKLMQDVRVWLSGGEAAVSVTAMTLVRDPMPGDIRNLAARAAFPVVFPAASRNARIGMMMYAPADRPTVIAFIYRGVNEVRPILSSVIIVQTSTITTDMRLLPQGADTPTLTHANTFRIRSETVLMPRNATPQSQSALQAQMSKATPQQSLLLAQQQAVPFDAVGTVPAEVDRALVHAAQSKGGTLVGGKTIALIRRLAQQRRALLDTRTVSLTNIPQSARGPEYEKATYVWPKAMALPASDVARLAAVLRQHPAWMRCGCALLVRTHSGQIAASPVAP